MRTTTKSTTIHPATGLVLSTAVLCGLGLLFVFEASASEAVATFNNQFHFLQQHAIGLAIGLIGFVAGYLIPTHWFEKTAPLWYIGSIILLLLVFVPSVGLTLNGAARWISIGGVLFQPVELVKFAVIVFFAQWLSKHQRLAPFVCTTALVCGLILLQPNLSSTLLIGAIATGMYYVAGGNMKHIGLLFLAAVPAVLVAIFTSSYRLRRLTTFLNPESDPLGASFHIRQITFALGRGGFTGQGIGESQQKFAFIPEASTDSIFAIIAEEIGFVGSLALIGLFAFFIWSGYTGLLNKQKSKFAQLLGMGILLWIGLQIVVNLSAVVGLIPLTGMPLPFISYGRSSLIMILFATGVLTRIVKTT